MMNEELNHLEQLDSFTENVEAAVEEALETAEAAVEEALETVEAAVEEALETAEAAVEEALETVEAAVEEALETAESVLESAEESLDSAQAQLDALLGDDFSEEEENEEDEDEEEENEEEEGEDEENEDEEEEDEDEENEEEEDEEEEDEEEDEDEENEDEEDEEEEEEEEEEDEEEEEEEDEEENEEEEENAPPSPIDYSNIAVDTLTFVQLTHFSVEQRLNEHGKAKIVGTMDNASATDAVSRIDETTVFKVTTTADNQHDTLFVGCVEDITLEEGAVYSKVTVNLLSLSCKMDLLKESRSFQDSTEEYQDLIDEAVGSLGTVTVEVDDETIDELILQYEETAWDFSKRMGSHLSAPLVPTLNVDVPTYSVGIPPSSKTVVVDTVATKYWFNSLDFAEYTENATSATLIAADFSQEWVTTDAYLFVGDTITLNGTDKRVVAVKGSLQDGILEMEYGLAPSDAVHVPKINCETLVGKMLLAEVKEVALDKVEVHFLEIDENHNSDGDCELPFSTAYSSSDGSGWYCMPEKTDHVRVCFPTNVASEAFVASSVCLIAPTNTRNKSWKAPGGKEILLTDEGMYIIGNAGKLFINLTDSDGIQLYSSDKITISSDGSVELKAAKSIKMIAENEMVVGTEKAYINLKSGSASVVADKVKLN